MKLLPLIALLLAIFLAGGCARKAAVKPAVSQEMLKATIDDFAKHIPTQGDTLYLAVTDQDPPAALLGQVKSDHVHILPASLKDPASNRTTFTLYPDSASVGDSVNLKIKWQVGARGGTGVAVVVRHGATWAVAWDWRTSFGS